MDIEPDSNGIITIDTHYVSRGIAAAYLIESKGKYAVTIQLP